MSIFTMADLHLSLSADKPMDIFKGWDDYIPRILKNWNSVVGDDDTVIVPGDISWAMSLDDALKDFDFLNNTLNGRKIILKGNHDYWWNTMSKMNAFLSANGFDRIRILHNNAFEVEGVSVAGSRGWFYDDTAAADKKVILREAARLRTSIAEAKKLSDNILVFLHYPPISDTQRCDEILDVIISENIKRCWFGHLHGFVSPANSHIEYEGTEFNLISADKLEFCPKLITF